MGMGQTASGPTGSPDEYVVTYCRVRAPARPSATDASLVTGLNAERFAGVHHHVLHQILGSVRRVALYKGGAAIALMTRFPSHG